MAAPVYAAGSPPGVTITSPGPQPVENRYERRGGPEWALPTWRDNPPMMAYDSRADRASNRRLHDDV